MHNDDDSLELRSSTWLMPMALTTCSYHGRHRHIAKAYTAGKMSSCSKVCMSVACCGYKTMHAGVHLSLCQKSYLDSMTTAHSINLPFEFKAQCARGIRDTYSNFLPGKNAATI